MHIPEHVRAQLERIRAEGEQQIERLRADAIAEALAMAQRLRGRDTDLIPLHLLCKHLAHEAMQAEPLIRRKQIAHYETARIAVRNAKVAISAGSMIPRDQGAGLAMDLSQWCAEDETLRAIDDFMPHSRVMVRRSDARNWFESMGADLPGFLPREATSTPPTPSPPAVLEATKQKATRRKTERTTEANRAIRAILRNADRGLSRAAAYSFVMQAIRKGDVPPEFKIREGSDESGGKAIFWTDTKGKENALKLDTLRRTVRATWCELFPSNP